MPATLINPIIAIIILSMALSCKLTEKDFSGKYALREFPKTTLQINPDKTFEFVKNNPNPYLHPFDHPAENYFITKGTWKKPEGNTIVLTSQADSVAWPLFDITSAPPREKNNSYFTFYDTAGDTVRLLYTQFSDGALMGRLHGTSPYASLNLMERDTFEFHFYGYRPVKFISGQRKNLDYSIVLKPEFQPGFFNEAEFRVGRRKIIDVKRHGKFQKIKHGF